MDLESLGETLGFDWIESLVERPDRVGFARLIHADHGVLLVETVSGAIPKCDAALNEESVRLH